MHNRNFEIHKIEYNVNTIVSDKEVLPLVQEIIKNVWGECVVGIKLMLETCSPSTIGVPGSCPKSVLPYSFLIHSEGQQTMAQILAINYQSV